ncbi:hypothetical protein CQW23_05583 [Capsicum baccatum]|uniref:Uncharacterized protein n=1 Tax=Capsicum baccatum TaxID=33114 RepID=A0A2G2XHZ9_CAPBA|nr:hypothetical protein CQW23_05583 [Capsicum baccatum]
MLTLPQWQSLNLIVNFFSTKYKMNSAGCLSLPEHMTVQVRALDELPCYTGIDRDEIDGTKENIDEHVDWREEHIERADENSTPDREDPEHSYIIIDSPAKASSSIQSGSFHTADIKDIHELDDEFDGKLVQQANRLCSTKTHAYHDPLPTKNAGLSSEVEVIDLFTPPCYKVSADSKKRRVSTTCPEIIDLTESPIYV